MCICIVGFHWMKTDFICRQNGVILISRSTCYVRWEIGVEGQDWKLFDMHMVGCFHMLMRPAWLTFSPAGFMLGVHISLSVSLFPILPFIPPPLPVRPTLHISTPLILFFFPFLFCFCSVNISQQQSSRVFCLLGAALISSASSRWCRTSSALTADANNHSNTLHSCHLHAGQPCHWLWDRQKML